MYLATDGERSCIALDMGGDESQVTVSNGLQASWATSTSSIRPVPAGATSRVPAAIRRPLVSDTDSHHQAASSICTEGAHIMETRVRPRIVAESDRSK